MNKERGTGREGGSATRTLRYYILLGGDGGGEGAESYIITAREKHRECIEKAAVIMLLPDDTNINEVLQLKLQFSELDDAVGAGRACCLRRVVSLRRRVKERSQEALVTHNSVPELDVLAQQKGRIPVQVDRREVQLVDD